MTTKSIWDSHPLICHYTKFENIIKILEGKALWATHFSQLNDFSEIYHAKKNILELFLKHFRRYVRGKSNTYAAVNYLFERMKQFIYITSFCILDPEKKDDGILSMWRCYGGNDGCYIEFDTKLFYDSLGPDTYRIFNKVFYDEEQPEVKLQLSEIRESFEFYFKTGIPVQETFGDFFTYVCNLKHPGFEEEKEIRMAIMNGFGVEKQPPCLPIKQSPLGRNYIELTFQPTSVKKIVIGPSQHQKDMQNTLKKWRRSQPEYRHLLLGKSEIPYRSSIA